MLAGKPHWNSKWNHHHKLPPVCDPDVPHHSHNTSEPFFPLFHQSQQESHSRTVSSLTAQLRDARQELREKEKEKKEADRALQNDREDRERGERRLRDSLEKRDKLIEVKKQFVPLWSILASYSEPLKSDVTKIKALKYLAFVSINIKKLFIPRKMRFCCTWQCLRTFELH